jgi:hypothetical protein
MSARGNDNSSDAAVAPEPGYVHDERFAARGKSLSWPAKRATLLWLIPIGIGIAYVIAFLVQLPRDVAQLSWDPSVASAYVMPETLVKTGTGGFTLMGSSPQWVSLWFGLLTARLPWHRELWGVAPTLVFVASALIVGWSVAQLASRRAAILAVLIGLVVSPLALAFFMAPFSHNTVYPCTALLGAYLIWLARGEGRRRITAVAVPLLLGVVVGTCLASDLLLAATAIVPLALTAILAGVRRDRRSRLVAMSALVTVVVALPIAKLTASIMRSSGYLTLEAPVKRAALSELPARAKLLFKGLKALFNGYLGTERPGVLHTELGFASDVVMCAALLALVAVGTWTTVRFVVSGLRKLDTGGTGELARSLHIIYWVGAAAIPCAGFWVAGEGPVTTHESYYATAIFAVAAVIPLLLSSGALARWLIAAGSSVLFVASFAGLSDDYVNVAAVLARNAKTLTKVAQANHVQFGYSNWGDSSGLTWGTHGRVTIRPVVECQTQQGVGLCPGFQALVPSWYVPQQRHTFLLLDANETEVTSVPAILGKPIAAYSFESMRMYIYSYDIASRLGPPEE